MTQYLLVYHGGEMEETSEEVEKAMADWAGWIEGLGEAIVDPGNAAQIQYLATLF